MLEVAGLCAGYLGKDVVRDADFHVDAGEAVAIIGSNGAGKTTLFRAVCGLVRPSSGTVRFDGGTVTGQSTFRIARLGLSTCPPSGICSRR
jgi:branched-chain amino acid transport system ATP-binding protein